MHMSGKIQPSKPFLVFLYGYPGSGKSLFGKQLADEIERTVYLSADKIQHDPSEDLKNQSGYSQTLFNAVQKYMAQEYLKSGISVVLDTPAMKKSERRMLKNIAVTNKCPSILIWLQIDPESAFARLKKRDRRKSEDKYAVSYTAEQFQAVLSNCQNPENEDYTVISGKHNYKSQRVTVLKKLYDMGVIKLDQSIQNIAKPELVNLIPKLQSRGQFLRRNISIR